MLLELFAFMLDAESLAGTVIEKRIIEYCARGNSKASSVYKLKVDPAKNLSRNVKMYTDQ